MNLFLTIATVFLLAPISDTPPDLNAKDQLITQQQQEIDTLNGTVAGLMMDKDNQELQNIYFKIMFLRPTTKPAVAKEIAFQVVHQAAANGVDPDLVLAIMRYESYFELRSHSWSGARGLMQILLPYWQEDCGLTVKNMYEAEPNIRCGIKVLLTYQQRYDNLYLALVAYNAGPDTVDYLLKHRLKINYGYARVVKYYYTQLKSVELVPAEKPQKQLLGF